MFRHRKAFRSILPAAAIGAATLVSMTGGCSGGGDDSGGLLESIFGSSSTSVPSGTQPSRPDEPMTLFEKRRLVARLQQDPRALQRMSPRERREVAAMVAAANANQDDDERD